MINYNRDCSEIKVGDKVVLHSLRNEAVYTVTRITKTCFDINDGYLYNKKNGTARGWSDPWSPRYCSIATEDDYNRLKEKVNKYELLGKINTQIRTILNDTTIDTFSLPIEKLVEFNEFLSKYTNKV